MFVCLSLGVKNKILHLYNMMFCYICYKTYLSYKSKLLGLLTLIQRELQNQANGKNSMTYSGRELGLPITQGKC